VFSYRHAFESVIMRSVPKGKPYLCLVTSLCFLSALLVQGEEKEIKREQV